MWRLLFALALLPIVSFADRAGLVTTDQDCFRDRIDILSDPQLRSIDIASFYVDNDDAGSALMGLLVEAAERGVKIRGIFDNRIYHGSAPLQATLEKSGINIRYFHRVGLGALRDNDPVEAALLFNKRMHDKLLIATYADGHRSLVLGDKNYKNKYWHQTESLHPGLDALYGQDVYVEGPAVDQALAYFNHLWNGNEVSAISPMPPQPLSRMLQVRSDLAKAVAWMKRASPASPWRKNIIPLSAPARFFHDDFDARGNRVRTTLQKIYAMIAAAPPRSHIIVENAYFVYHDEMREAFQAALRKGSQIAVLTNDPTSNNQQPFVAGAMKVDLDKLRDTGIDLYFLRKGDEVHSKVVKINDTLIMTSANFDPRSYSLNSESGLILPDARLANEYAQIFLRRARRGSPAIVRGKIVTAQDNCLALAPYVENPCSQLGWAYIITELLRPLL